MAGYQRKLSQVSVPSVPPAPNWKQLIADLIGARVPKAAIARAANMSRETLYSIFYGSGEPSHSQGVRLIAVHTENIPKGCAE